MHIKIRNFLLILLIIGPHFQVRSDDAAPATDVEDFEFQAEVGRLMDIIINSLYTEKEIFLRELISNASDALDKIRYLSIENPEELDTNRDLKIRIEGNSDEKTVTITDSGIGMTKNDLIGQLGTIAKSGTTQFIEAIKGGNVNIIGQFGVGFYSAFLVSQRVQVTSKNNDDDQWVWESSAANSFTVYKDPNGNTLGRGTQIKLFLKQEAEEFTEEKVLTELIQTYSEFINFPIWVRTSKEKEIEIKTEDDDGDDGVGKSDDDIEILDDDADKDHDEEGRRGEKKKKKTRKEIVYDWKVANDNKAIWVRAKEDIEDDEYRNFYKSMTKDYDPPSAWIHFKAEGEVEFTCLLYAPKKAPHDLFDNYHNKGASLRLYVRRVLINEEFEELLPKYLNFITGVVDSDELPINVSRDSIQQLKMMKVISRKLVRKALEMVRKLADAEDEEDDSDEDESDDDKIDKEEYSSDDEEEKEKKLNEKKQKYNDFYTEFGKNIKLGIIEDSSNRQKLAELSRWWTSKNVDELSSLEQYMDRMKPGQDQIYYLAGETKGQVMKQPVLQKLLQKGYEVLVLDDPIDEYVFQHLTEFEKKRITNVARGDFNMPEDDDNERKKLKKIKKMYEPLTRWWKDLLKEEVDDCVVSKKLVSDPCVVVSQDYGQSANMQRIQNAQAYSGKQDTKNKNKIEINHMHPAIQELLERVKDDPDTEAEELAIVLYEGAAVTSGYPVKDSLAFSERFYKLFNGAIGIARDAPLKDIEIELSDEEVETDSDETSDDPDRPKSSPEDSTAGDSDDDPNESDDDDDSDSESSDNSRDDL